MGRLRTAKGGYTKQQLQEASSQVMKSLYGKKKEKVIPQLKPGSVEKPIGSLSKSARKRENRKLRSNLAGASMDTLIDSLPQVPSEPPTEPAKVPMPNPHKSRKAARRVENAGINEFKRTAGTPLDDLKQKILKNLQV